MKILVATDGSKASLRGVKYAAKLSAQLTGKTRITLISVHDDAGLRHINKFIPKDTVSDYLREQGDKATQGARALLDKAAIDHDIVLVTGHVAEEIVRVGKVGKFDLIVMGGKGRSSFGDLLLGSVAQRVSATADRPVLLVK